MIKCDEIITVMDIVSTKKTNTTAKNVMSTAPINCHSKKVRDCYILHTVLLVIILLLIITIIAIIMQNKNELIHIYKMENNEIEKVRIKSLNIENYS